MWYESSSGNRYNSRTATSTSSYWNVPRWDKCGRCCGNVLTGGGAAAELTRCDTVLMAFMACGAVIVGDGCYRPVRNDLSCGWLSYNLKIKIRRNIVLCVDKKIQLDVNFCILYFSSNSCSTCFGQPCAHHQELTTA